MIHDLAPTTNALEQYYSAAGARYYNPGPTAHPPVCQCGSKTGRNPKRRGLGFLPVEDAPAFDLNGLNWPWIIAGALALLAAVWIFKGRSSPVTRARRSRRAIRRIKEA